MGELIISSMCTGIGSFEMAMRNLKIPHISRFAIEIDKYAKQTFLANFETETMYDDMTTYDYIGDKWYSDLLVAGIPCQAFSLAGKRLGELDARGLLFYDFYRYVKNQQPKYFIIENVKWLLSMDKGNVFNNWKALLGQSENGAVFLHTHEDSLMYNLHWKVLNTKNYGLPQNRERVFLIGIRKDLPNDFVFPKEIPLELRLKDLLEESVDDKYYLKNMQDRLFKTLKTSELCSDIEFIDAYNQKVYKDGTTNTINTRVDASNHSYIRVPNKSNKNDIIQINPSTESGGKQPYQQNRIYDEKGISPCLMKEKSDLLIGTWRTHKDGNGFREIKENISPTIPARAREDGSGQPVINENAQIRRLTEIECERLQGFPDNWTEYGNYDGVIKKIPKTQRYKMLGNAVTVKVVEEIAKRFIIYKHEPLTKHSR